MPENVFEIKPGQYVRMSESHTRSKDGLASLDKPWAIQLVEKTSRTMITVQDGRRYYKVGGGHVGFAAGTRIAGIATAEDVRKWKAAKDLAEAERVKRQKAEDAERKLRSDLVELFQILAQPKENPPVSVTRDEDAPELFEVTLHGLRADEVALVAQNIGFLAKFRRIP